MASTYVPDGNSFGETVQWPASLPDVIPDGGPVKFPETAEEESRRVGQYFIDHPVLSEEVTRHDEN